ncbi:hypothetical protein Btru_004623 [Bulinus truncatus]|nr:hypothetical protein Btru_004623 [Bulinus truncatus]
MDDAHHIERLLQASHDAKLRAYCPYGHQAVGAAVLTTDNQIIAGCNVENESHPLTICAERVALVKAVSEGHHRFKAIAIASSQPDVFVTPCGTCRQFLLEFGDDIAVYMTRPDMRYTTSTSGQL